MASAIMVAIAIFAAVAAGTLILRRKSDRLSREVNERSSELQHFLTTCAEDLRDILDRDGVSVESKRIEANMILARMESWNVEGQLDEFIQDNRESVEPALRRGNAA